MGAIKAGQRPSRSVTNARNVPASGEAVNDGLRTALRFPGALRVPRTAGPGRGRGGRVEGRILPGNRENPDKSSFFLVYQNGPADITIAGAATES
jgi:hypothetical protein